MPLLLPAGTANKMPTWYILAIIWLIRLLLQERMELQEPLRDMVTTDLADGWERCRCLTTDKAERMVLERLLPPLLSNIFKP